MQIFDFIKRLHVTVLSAIHDLNMAALYCDRIYVLKDGRIVLQGRPEDVLTPETIYDGGFLSGVYLPFGGAYVSIKRDEMLRERRADRWQK